MGTIFDDEQLENEFIIMERTLNLLFTSFQIVSALSRMVCVQLST